jgi:hypothetical protein
LLTKLTGCPHCGATFSRIIDEIPIVIRSDTKTFHLALFSVTYARSNSLASDHGQQIMCHFEYVHDRFGSESKSVAVTVLDANQAAVTRYQIEAAADSLAELMQQGNRLEGAYIFDKGQLVSGFQE